MMLIVFPFVIIDTIVKYQKMKDMNFDKSLIQGMITSTMKTGSKATILLMYIKAPENLSRNKNRYLFKPSWMHARD